MKTIAERTPELRPGLGRAVLGSTWPVVVGNVIENMNLCKCFNIVCEHPQPICNFIIHELNRSATTFEARGAYSDAHKTVIMTTMRRSQAIRLRNFIRQQEPTAFIMIENSSEIIGKGFNPV